MYKTKKYLKDCEEKGRKSCLENDVNIKSAVLSHILVKITFKSFNGYYDDIRFFIKTRKKQRE